MLTRRNLAIALGSVVLAAPALTACGFYAATDHPNTIQNGVNNSDHAVKIGHAVVVSATPGSGTFVATLSNDDGAPADSLDSLEAGSTEGGLEFGEFTAFDVPAGGQVRLAEVGGVTLTGDFEAGDFVDVRLGFASGERVSMSIPVVADDGYFAGLDISSESAG